MSIIRKIKSTEEYRRKLETAPQSTRNNKNNACWWAAGMITDEDFASGIEYLVKEGIIIV